MDNIQFKIPVINEQKYQEDDYFEQNNHKAVTYPPLSK